MLSLTQDYLIQVIAAGSDESFMLNISTPARITFDVGSITKKLDGSTPDGLNTAYILRANAGQTMNLELTAENNNAVLSVYGFEDGNPYLRYVVEKSSFSMVLPKTQDYIIQVVPRAGMVVNYSLVITIQ